MTRRLTVGCQCLYVLLPSAELHCWSTGCLNCVSSTEGFASRSASTEADMNILQILGLLQLLAVPAFMLTQPTQDYWGEFGAYGPCSRTCGTGVAMRTRKCITARTDGGHNCVGSSKAFRTCNTQACPAGTRDFREDQCNQYNRLDFQGKRYSWVPYYGATNPCELNCVPTGENFPYRHRPIVVDGTPCYVGRSDICVDGVCRTLTHGEFMGLDDAQTAGSQHHVPAAVATHPTTTQTYAYTIGVYGECSAACNGGMQYRSVDCVVQDSVTPRVVDATYCITQRMLRPASQQACNMHACAATGGATDGAAVVVAEYSVGSFSVCSVTCGDGQQTREVVCVGAGGERLDDHACRGVARPADVQVCRRPACTISVTWHVTDYGLCIRSCGGGVRERRVACFDLDLHPYAEDRCGAHRPATVESCNSQPCPGAQMVPSVQDPQAHESTMRGFVPYVGGETSVSAPRCTQTYYGCCPDGHSSATGPRYEGCSHGDCINTRFGCCRDGVNTAQGFGMAGCPEYVAPEYVAPVARYVDTPLGSPAHDVCSLRREAGPCDTWKVRFYYNSATHKCTEFWYGSCQGNANNFMTLGECQRHCGGVREPATSRRVPTRRGYRSRA